MNDFYDLIPKSKKKTFNESKCLVPHPSRDIIAGTSGSWKTNCLLNLIDAMNCFTEVYIYAKMIESDPLYNEIFIPNIRNIEKMEKISIIKAVDRDVSLLPLVESLSDEGCKLFIFDDLINCCDSDMAKIANYYIASRKRNCTIVFITQDYLKLPAVIRTNANTVIFTKLSRGHHLRSCLYDVDEYEKVKSFYNKCNKVFVKTVDEKGKTIFAMDNFKKPYSLE